MNELALHEFINGHVSAIIYKSGADFKVEVYNSKLDKRTVAYFDSEQLAENFAEDLVLK